MLELWSSGVVEFWSDEGVIAWVLGVLKTGAGILAGVKLVVMLVMKIV